MIYQYVIAVGSNYNSDISFKIAMDELKKLGSIISSSVVVGQDFTGNTSLIYHNAIIMIVLFDPLDCNEFNQLLKNIERYCNRKDDTIYIPMDLDILAFYDNDWQIIKKRLPFKEHEKKGLIEVAPFLLKD